MVEILNDLPNERRAFIIGGLDEIFDKIANGEVTEAKDAAKMITDFVASLDNEDEQNYCELVYKTMMMRIVGDFDNEADSVN